jgi:hypothetical protein
MRGSAGRQLPAAPAKKRAGENANAPCLSTKSANAPCRILCLPILFLHLWQEGEKKREGHKIMKEGEEHVTPCWFIP